MLIRAVTAGAVLVATVALAAPASAETVTMIPMDGVTPDGLGTWQVQAGQLSDGQPAVIEVFNAASRASAHRVIDAVRAEAPRDVAWEFESTTQVMFRSFAIGQVISGTRSATMRAQVITYVSTVVIDSRSGQPIAATPENFANWVPTADGVEVHFPSSLLFWPSKITVPWSELTDVIAPNMAGLVQA